MIQAAERTRVPLIGARLGAGTQKRFLLLRAEILAGSPLLARIGLIATALSLQTLVLVSPGHFRPAPNALFAILVTLGTLGSLALAFFSTLDLGRMLRLRVRQSLGAVGLALLVVLSIAGVKRGADSLSIRMQGTPYNNDGAVMDYHAAQRLRDGHNPYRATNIVQALADLNAPATTTTPLERGQFGGAQAYPSEGAQQQVFFNDLRHRFSKGLVIPPEFESKYNYPAGSFLFILPFVFAGLNDMRFLYALAMLAMGAYLWLRLPRAFRPLSPLLLLGSVPLVLSTTGGQPDPIYGLFLMIGYAEWRKRHLSPVCMGIAIATKQLAWFFVPFYVVLIVREFGWREGARRVGVMTLLFVATNGPFILQSPGSYLTSISAPMSDPMFPLGIGVIALFVSNVVPMLPKIAFAAAQLIAWVGGAGAFARLRLSPASGVVLAALPLFFAWRSLVNYFYLVPLLTLAVVLAESSAQQVHLKVRNELPGAERPAYVA